jgi:hypothetical protein
MKQNILLLVVAGLSLVPASGLFAGQAEKAAKPAPAKKAVLRAASEMKWVDIPDAKGAQQAVAWGNPQKGACLVRQVRRGNRASHAYAHRRLKKRRDCGDDAGGARRSAAKRTRTGFLLLHSWWVEAHYRV